MKSNFLLLAFLGMASFMQAQQFVLYKSDGTKLKLNAGEIDSVAVHNDDWQDPDGTPNRVRVSLTATIGDDENKTKGINKVAFGGNADNKTMLWQKDDAISVYSLYSTSEEDKFTLSNGVGTKEGTFTGTTYKVGDATVLYPYQSQTSLSNDAVCSVILPVVQTAAEGSFFPKAGLMIGKCSDLSTINSNPVTFKNICSYIAVTPTFHCTQIIISTYTPEEYLSGSVKVNYNNGSPTWSIVNGSNKVSIFGDIKANTTYYIAVLPGTLNGIRVTCFNGGTYSTMKTSTTVELPRSQYTDLSSALASPTKASYVDLGLSVKWATMNVGATAPYEYGDYFAWGEVTPMNAYYYENYMNSYKYDCSWYQYYYGQETDLLDPYNSIEKQETLLPENDAATKYLGSGWRMPSKTEFQELVDNCVWEYTDNYNNSGIKGFIIYKKTNDVKDTSAYIFLPYTGRFEKTSLTAPNSTIGYYWSSSVNPTDYTKAYDLKISTDTSSDPKTNYATALDIRPYGCTIRPVYDVKN